MRLAQDDKMMASRVNAQFVLDEEKVRNFASASEQRQQAANGRK
jgi:hypothetical protein